MSLQQLVIEIRSDLPHFCPNPAFQRPAPEQVYSNPGSADPPRRPDGTALASRRSSPSGGVPWRDRQSLSSKQPRTGEHRTWFRSRVIHVYSSQSIPDAVRTAGVLPVAKQNLPEYFSSMPDEKQAWTQKFAASSAGFLPCLGSCLSAKARESLSPGLLSGCC